VTRAVLALGANLGDARGAVRGAMDALATTPGITVIARSSLYETDPVGGPEQPRFVNAVVMIETTLEPYALLAAAHVIEGQWQRTRDVHWGPRTLDIDVIHYEGVQQDVPDLTLPHPRAADRGFVLLPWLEIDPNASLPEHGVVIDLLAALDVSDIERIPST
jgi:2-amino-4-hydroxy-6-hydroxymethyldihydropteridine diphosphokinase